MKNHKLELIAETEITGLERHMFKEEVKCLYLAANLTSFEIVLTTFTPSLNFSLQLRSFPQ